MGNLNKSAPIVVKKLALFHFLTHGVAEIDLMGYNLLVEKNFFQVFNQSFQYNHQYQGQQNVILYPVYNMFLICLFVCLLERFFLDY